MMRSCLALVAAPLVLGLQGPPEDFCPKTCDPSTVIAAVGPDWTATFGPLVYGRGRANCTNCWPCSSSITWTFDPDSIFSIYSTHTDNGGSNGIGPGNGWVRVKSDCDDPDPGVFTGSGGSGGITVQLYCICDP